MRLHRWVCARRSPGDVLETFNFLENAEDSDEDDDDDDDDGELMDDMGDDIKHRRKHKSKVGKPWPSLRRRSFFFFFSAVADPSVIRFLCPQVGNEGLASEEDDADTEEALKEFDFLATAEDGEGAGEARSSGDGTEWGEFGGALTRSDER